jgi:hypothetical protein
MAPASHDRRERLKHRIRDQKIGERIFMTPRPLSFAPLDSLALLGS